LNARTGELTPPGITCCAFANAASEAAKENSVFESVLLSAIQTAL
jgi:hypothetical protein